MVEVSKDGIAEFLAGRRMAIEAEQLVISGLTPAREAFAALEPTDPRDPLVMRRLRVLLDAERNAREWSKEVAAVEALQAERDRYRALVERLVDCLYEVGSYPRVSAAVGIDLDTAYDAARTALFDTPTVQS